MLLTRCRLKWNWPSHVEVINAKDVQKKLVIQEAIVVLQPFLQQLSLLGSSCPRKRRVAMCQSQILCDNNNDGFSQTPRCLYKRHDFTTIFIDFSHFLNTPRWDVVRHVILLVMYRICRLKIAISHIETHLCLRRTAVGIMSKPSETRIPRHF